MAWFSQVHIQDADNGLEAINTDFVTAQNISFSFTAPRQAACCYRRRRWEPWHKGPRHITISVASGALQFCCCCHCCRNAAELSCAPAPSCRGVKTTTQDCSGHHGLWAAASSNVLFTE